MISYAAYLRDSGGAEQELSISQQEAALTAWAANNDCVITQWFRDAARPGSTTVGREGFQNMMTFFRDGCQESGLVVWKMSRFAREINDSQFFRADLRRRGYKVISINDPIPEGPEGIFFEAAIDWMNSRFLEDLSRDVKRGLSNLLLVYGAVGGVPPVGFKRQPVELPPRRDGRPHTACRWVPDPDQVPNVRQAWEMRAAGRPISEIHSTIHLYDSYNGYTDFFRNRLYVGIMKRAGQVIEHYCAPIVDQVTWDAVQEINRRQINHLDSPRRKNSRYLLSGLAHCARCGSPLNGSTTIKQENGLPYDKYVCSKAARHGDCDFRPIPRKVLESAVIAAIREQILTPGNLVALQAITLSGEQDRLANLDEERRAAHDRLATILRKVSNVTESIADSGSSRALLDKLKALEADEAAARSQFADLERQADKQDREMTLEQMTTLIDFLLNQEPRALFASLIDRINVDRDGRNVFGQIIYHPPRSTSTPTHHEVQDSSRRTFAYCFTAQMRSWTKKPR